jgi:hypothetical protein
MGSRILPLEPPHLHLVDLLADMNVAVVFDGGRIFYRSLRPNSKPSSAGGESRNNTRLAAKERAARRNRWPSSENLHRSAQVVRSRETFFPSLAICCYATRAELRPLSRPYGAGIPEYRECVHR